MSSWFNSPPPPPDNQNRRQPPPPSSSHPSPPTRYSSASTTTNSSRPRPPAPSYDYDYEDRSPQQQYDNNKRQPAPPTRSHPPPPTTSNQRRMNNEKPQPPTGRPGRYHVVEAPSTAYALTNCIIVNEQDWAGVPYVVINRDYILTVKTDNLVPVGSIGASKLIRTWVGLSLPGDVADVEPYDISSAGSDIYLASLDLEIGFWFEKNATTDVYDAEAIGVVFSRAYEGVIFSTGQLLAFEYKGQNMKATVRGVLSHSLGEHKGGFVDRVGVLTPQTELNFMKNPASSIKIKSSAKKAPPNAILSPTFKFEDMGIGGLDAEFTAIFRRAFASRVFPLGLVEKLGIQHVKGILLYGPPGTGKTLMARQIGKMLNAREPKVVNGPEILNKFVGQSEENIRKLFGDAEKEYKEKGDESGLHIIIFDELDAICKQRGSTNNGTGVGDSVVNQLLSKMDGVDQLNNILIIGMTNRLDMIDEALLRPGRLEVHIEISLPDEAGRVQILNIHTNKMKTNGVMGRDVDIVELASMTKNFSGAEIGGLVKSATSFAFNRHVKVGTLAGISDDIDQIQVGRADFMLALDEVQPAFGVNEEELHAVVQNGIIHFGEHIHRILRDGKLLVEQVRSSERTPLVSVLLHGPPGSGKTALAATLAMASEFPFIKLVSAENMVGFSEAQKITHINKVFTDSYKSPLSVIVVDGIERILGWVPIGPRFSAGVLEALVVLLGKRPPKERRLLVISTTSNRQMLSEMDVMDSFAAELRVPAIDNLKSLLFVLRDIQLFRSQEEYDDAWRLLHEAKFDVEGRVNIGVKKLLSLAEMCRQDSEGAAGQLVSKLLEHSAL